MLGVFIDFTGQGQLCLTKEHNVVHIGHELDQPWIDAAPRRAAAHAGRAPRSRRRPSLVNLLAETGKLKGKTVAVLGDKNNESRVNDIIVPALKKAKAKTGSTAILTITGTDTTAAQAQLDSFIEKWKSEGVNMVFLVRERRLGQAVRRDDQAGAAEGAARHRHRHHARPGQGRAERRGRSRTRTRDPDQRHRASRSRERWANKSPLLQQCVDIYQKATGTTVPGPDERKVDSDGKQVNTDQAVTDFCGELFMFKTIAEKVGPNLTAQELAEDGQLVRHDRTSCPTSSRRSARASTPPRTTSSWSPTTRASATTGDWKTLTPIKDASDGKCAKAAGSGT